MGGSAGMRAQSYTVGDVLTDNGVYSPGSEIIWADGDVVYGAFDKITIGVATEYVIAYIGR